MPKWKNCRNLVGRLAAWSGGKCTCSVPMVTGFDHELYQWDPPQRERMTMALLEHPTLTSPIIISDLHNHHARWIFHSVLQMGNQWVDMAKEIAWNYTVGEGQSLRGLAILLLTPKHAALHPFYSLTSCTCLQVYNPIYHL